MNTMIRPLFLHRATQKMYTSQHVWDQLLTENLFIESFIREIDRVYYTPGISRAAWKSEMPKQIFLTARVRSGSNFSMVLLRNKKTFQTTKKNLTTSEITTERTYSFMFSSFEVSDIFIPTKCTHYQFRCAVLFDNGVLTSNEFKTFMEMSYSQDCETVKLSRAIILHQWEKHYGFST